MPKPFAWAADPDNSPPVRRGAPNVRSDPLESEGDGKAMTSRSNDGLVTQAPVVRIKVFGERNTGTNFVEKVIRPNLACELCAGNLSKTRRWYYYAVYRLLPYETARRIVEASRDLEYKKKFQIELGWKHAKLPNLPDGTQGYPTGTGFIAVVKNPYSWLLSMHARPYQKAIKTQTSFSAFLREPWPTVGREHAERLSYDNPIQMWNDKVASYYTLHKYGPSIIVRYEDVLESVEAFVARISTAFSLKPHETLIIPSKSTKPDGRTTEDICNYYRSELWRAKLRDDDVEYINTHLDKELAISLGYQILGNGSLTIAGPVRV
jgi:hypothetical protein